MTGDYTDIPLLSKSTLAEAAAWVSSLDEKGGIVLVNKPLQWTSFDVVAKLRSTLRRKKIGHAGTLDPLATGLLVICVERKATRIIDLIQALPKEYIATLRLGATTPSFDAEFPEENITSVEHLLQNNVLDSINEFIGEIQQVPPMYSAIKKDGIPLYKHARKGHTIEVQPRTVTIHSIEILEYYLPKTTLSIRCSKGTYIRSLARDIGEKLGVGGYLAALHRSAIGDFSASDALDIEDFAALKQEGRIES